MKQLIGIIVMLWAGVAFAADSGVRTHPDPECLNRDADPGKCVIQDGPPPKPQVRDKVDLPPPIPVPKPKPTPPTSPLRTR